MHYFTFVPYYLFWHYTSALRDYIVLWMRGLWFITHFFSFEILMRTLFSPWRRLGELYPGRFDFAEMLAVFATNTIMRVLGFGVRAATLALGFVSLALGLVVGATGFFLWLIAPLVALVAFIAGTAIALGIY